MPSVLGLWAYISGKSLMPMLQLLHISLCMGGSKGKARIQIQCIHKRGIQLVKGMHIIIAA